MKRRFRLEGRMVRPRRVLIAGLFMASLLVHSRAAAEQDPVSQPETPAASEASTGSAIEGAGDETAPPVVSVVDEAASQPASMGELPPLMRSQPEARPAAAGPPDKRVRWSGTRDGVYKIFVSAGSVLGGLCLPGLGCFGTSFIASPELTMFTFTLAPQLGMALGATAVALFFGDPLRALSAGVVAALVGGAVSAAGFGALALLTAAVDNVAVQGAASYAWVATPLLAGVVSLTAFHVAFLWLLDQTPLQSLLAGRLATDEQESSAPDETSLPAYR